MRLLRLLRKGIFQVPGGRWNEAISQLALFPDVDSLSYTASFSAPLGLKVAYSPTNVILLHALEVLLYMHTQEQLAEGLHMIDFEQLKINNVDLNEKIEERNEDILKLKRKVTATVQVLTHVKEKLQFLQVLPSSVG